MRETVKSLMEERIEHIRKRPGMYIGRLGHGANEQDGIYNLLKIIFYSLINQFREGVSDEITVDVLDDKKVRISYPPTDIRYIEIVQALSSSFDIADVGGRTILSFTPDEAIFDYYQYKEHIVFHLLRSYCHANKGLVIIYDGIKMTTHNGMLDLMKERMSYENGYCYPIIHFKGNDIEVAFTHKTSDIENYHFFVNGVKIVGGTHLTAFKSAFARIISDFYADQDLMEEDILKGISAAISIDITEPLYEQANYGVLASTKVSPNGKDVRDAVYDFLNSALTEYLSTNPEVVQQLLKRISKSRDYRLQLQKYISLSPEELVDIWNETIVSGTTGTLWQIVDAFLAKKIQTIEIQKSRAIFERLRISYDKENNIIHCAGRHFFETSEKLFQL